MLALHVPRTSILGRWADAHRHLPADVLFRDAADGPVVETLRLAAAYCVHHREVFTASDIHTGSYILYLTLSDPDGFTMHAGPAVGFVVPAARGHGVPPVATGSGAKKILHSGNSRKPKSPPCWRTPPNIRLTGGRATSSRKSVPRTLGAMPAGKNSMTPICKM